MNDDPHGRHTELELVQGRRVVALRGKPKKGFLAPETWETQNSMRSEGGNLVVHGRESLRQPVESGDLGVDIVQLREAKS
jgi:hypothetical protein